MSKPDSLTSEPAAGLNRRGLLAAAGGVAVAGVLSTGALATSAQAILGVEPSPEFLEYRRHWVRYQELGAYPSPWADGHEAIFQQAGADTSDALSVLMRKPKPMCSWQHVIELGRAARMELYGETASEPELDALLTAIETMAAKGGVNV